MFEVVGAYILDLVIGDPRWLPHPVRWMGGVIEKGEALVRRYIRSERFGGVLLVLLLVISTYLLAWGFLSVAYLLHPFAGAITGAITIFFTISIKDLSGHAIDVYRVLSKGEISISRVFVSRMVGRQTSLLGKDELIRATVESVAESIVDGVVAPLFYAIIGGAPLAFSYRMVNTLDSMIGHKDKRYQRFGWAAARLDDLFNFIPARITIVLIPIASLILRKNFKDSLLTTLRDAKRHPSPNAGIPEAAVAGALGLRLGGISYYDGKMEERPHIGKRVVDFSPQHIIDSVSIMRVSSILILIAGILFKEVYGNG
jgi:adenosylcobinamide-phosphate synthase